MVYMYSPPYLSIFVDYLVVIGDSTNVERAFTPWRQLRIAFRVVMAKMRLPSWYGLATEGGGGEAICWWVSHNRWVIASTYSEGSSTAGDA